MKTINILTIIICIFVSQIADAQNWIWSKGIGGIGNEGTKYSCIDPNDNLYIAGRFESNPCYFNSDTLQPNGYYDFFIAKYDANGNELWVKSFGGNNGQMQYEGINSMVYDSQSNSIFASGSFWGTCSFDSFTFSSSGMYDAFVMKLDLNGNVVWVNKTGGIGEDGGVAMDVDIDGNVYVEYLFSSNGTIDTITTSSGVHFAKYNSNGNILWVKKKFNTNGTITGYDGYFGRIKIKGDKIFALGECSLDTFAVDTVNVYANFPNGQYIIGCFDTSANALWIKPCAGNNLTNAFGLGLDNNKNSYITGAFSQSGIFANDTIFNSNFADLFLAKYDSSGNFIWVHQTNSSFSAASNDLALSADAGVYITGVFYGTADFGTYTINSVANGDMFVARYDTSGLCIGVRHLGVAGGWSITCSNTGDFYCTGNFQNTITFPSNPSLTCHGSTDVYISKSSTITGNGGDNRIANNQLLIYANPNKGTCNVTIPDEFQHEKNLTLQIFDNTGKLLQLIPVQMSEDKVKINLEQEATGVYNVTLSNGKKSYNGKIVFE
jgi:type IX secretion system substrate protein